ncbi:1-aminocyclopropane-1-carboxylate synthase-like protein 1 [Glandiceps talaboti]
MALVGLLKDEDSLAGYFCKIGILTNWCKESFLEMNDFCMSGLRCGAIYSWNKQVISALGKIAFFFCASSPTQVTLNQLLADEEWMTNFMLTNCQRLKESHKFMSQELTKLGIPHLVRPAAIFIWIDLRQYISPLTFENELLLYQEFLDCGVYIPAGKGFFCSEPGWFRMVFTIPRDWQDRGLYGVTERLLSTWRGREGEVVTKMVSRNRNKRNPTEYVNEAPIDNYPRCNVRALKRIAAVLMKRK